MLQHTADLAAIEDRRVFERLLVEFSSRIIEPDREKTTLIICRDISAQGMGIIGSRALKTGDILKLWLDIPDSHQPLHLSGKVVWSMESEPGIWRAGIYFEQVELTRLYRIFEVSKDISYVA